MDKIDRLLSQIISLWRASDCDQAKDAVSLLQKVSNKRERPKSGLPPRIDLSKAKSTTGAEELFELLRCVSDLVVDKSSQTKLVSFRHQLMQH